MPHAGLQPQEEERVHCDSPASLSSSVDGRKRANTLIEHVVATSVASMLTNMANAPPLLGR